MPAPTAVQITLTDAEGTVLEIWGERRKTRRALALRARIVLAAAACLARIGQATIIDSSVRPETRR